MNANAIIEHEPTSSPVKIINADAGSLMAVISRAAADPSVDVDKLERLLGMYERVKANEAKAAFAAAMAEAKREMPQVVRRAENTQTNSKYATLEAVAAAVDPIISKHGFVPSFGTAAPVVDATYRVTCRLLHSAGHSEDYFADIPIDIAGIKGNQNKTPTHAFGSTMSYGRRYLKLMIFDIATKNQDDDGNGAGTVAITAEQLKTLRDFIELIEADEAKITAHHKLESLADLPAKKFDRTMQALKEWHTAKLAKQKEAAK